VYKVLQIFKEEFKLAMGLTGEIQTNFATVSFVQIDIGFSESANPSFTCKVAFVLFIIIGCANLKDISRDMVVHQSHYSRI
jgi:isopentenyl diphosphate isomerase/L-lactate dehydrogenase-like FMN-dependent dehydrogenase